MGLIHIYCGEGKGKTTAAWGLALRMAGRGKKVVAARFLKTDDSGEVMALGHLPGVEALPCEKSFGFTWQMTEETRKEAALWYQSLLERAFERAAELCQGEAEEASVLLILDELFSAISSGLVDEEQALSLLNRRPAGLEVAMTGRDPSPRMEEEADYVSEIRCRKHPYEKGIGARPGIEY